MCEIKRIHNIVDNIGYLKWFEPLINHIYPIDFWTLTVINHAPILSVGLYKKIKTVIPFGQVLLHRRIFLNHANIVHEKWLNETFNQLLTLKLNKLDTLFL